MTRTLGYTLLLICLFRLTGQSQAIVLQSIERKGDKLIVRYDLDDSNQEHEYFVQMFSSADKFAAPLTKLTGDVGQEIKPGKNRSITWAITSELGAFKGNIEIEVTARIFSPFVRVSLDNTKRYKRGKSYALTWTSGSLGGLVDIELYRGNTRVHSDRNVPNTGKFDWFIPGNVKPDKDYTIRFTNVRNRSEVVATQPFVIRPKVPLLAKVASVVVVGAGLTLISGSGAASGGSTVELPGPPDLPNR